MQMTRTFNVAQVSRTSFEHLTGGNVPVLKAVEITFSMFLCLLVRRFVISVFSVDIPRYAYCRVQITKPSITLSQPEPQSIAKSIIRDNWSCVEIIKHDLEVISAFYHQLLFS